MLWHSSHVLRPVCATLLTVVGYVPSRAAPEGPLKKNTVLKLLVPSLANEVSKLLDRRSVLGVGLVFPGVGKL